MGLILDGYRAERLLRAAGSGHVWSARRERDQLPVIAKAFTVHDSPELEARVAHEFELIRSLDCPGVVRALALERTGRELVLVLEAHDGIDLREHAGGRALPLGEFLPIAQQIAEILAEVHQRRVIHRDLKPTNILIDPATGAIALADFGISVLLDSERGRIHEPSVMAGTLPYMAPEQTGRTGREADVRSDLYSLGVTFYELLTGRRPFEADSPLELIHAHFARRPQPPQRLRPDLPTALSELVMKLLEKAPERRYQSARGLAADLARLREGLADGAAAAPFVLGAADVPLTLHMPHQLYGRRREREHIHEAFAAACARTPRFVVVVGPSGIGKSALLDELVEPVLAARGFLARGKCEDESNRPFSGLAAALGAVVDQLLTEGPELLASWQRRLTAVLGAFAPALCELIPRLSALLGDVGPGVVLAPGEARSQIQLGFARLLTELAQPEHPLVIALDDLQWIDGASVELLDSLFGAGELALLVLATAREQALEPGASLSELLVRLDARGLAATVLKLEPLTQAELDQMLADVLSQPVEQVAPLARVVARKTGNNPFFARQFLLLLVELGLLERGPAGWRWQLDALERAALPDDALEMMTAKLDRLDPELRELICTASVCGSLVEPGIVEQVLARSPGSELTIGAGFQRLIDEGLLSPGPAAGLLFAHDRIREAAYALLGPERQRAVHLAIGEALLARREAAAHGDRRVFEIADHLDRGHGLLDDAGADELERLDADRRERLIELNLRAGRQALGAGAPEAARVYLELATALARAHEPFPALGEPRRALHFDVRLAGAEAATLLGEVDEAQACFAELLDRELDPRELGRVGVARCWHLIRNDARAEAVAWGIEILRRLGLRIPRTPSMLDAALVLPRMLRLVRAAEPEPLSGRAPISDPGVLAAIDVILALNGSSYVVSPAAFVVLTAHHASLIEAHGDHPTRLLALAQVGLIVGPALGRRSECVRLCQRCLAASDASGDRSTRYRVHITALFAELWDRNLLELAAGYAEVVERALEHGDIETAGSAYAMRVELSLWGGAHLRTVAELGEARTRWARQWGSNEMLAWDFALAQAYDALTCGPAPEPGVLADRYAAGEAEDTVVQLSLWVELLLRCLVLAVFDRFAEILPVLEQVGPRLERAVPGTWHSLLIHVLLGIAAAERAHAAPTAGERRRRTRQARRSARTLTKQLAAGANVGHGVHLLAGELAGLAGDLGAAGREFAAARARAGEQRNPLFEALASERAAALALRCGLDRHALTPLADARSSYLRWGAFAKVAALDEQTPELARRAALALSSDEATGSSSGRASTSTTSRALDSATLLEASQAIAEDIRLDEVIARVLRLAVENAGAERGALLLGREGRLGLAAEHVVDAERTRLLEQPLPLAELGERLPVQVVRWVARTREGVVIGGAAAEPRFAADPYLAGGPRAILCAPIVKHGELIGLIYLENRLNAEAFTEQRLATLRLLAAQAGSALENAKLYDELRASEVRWRSLVEQLPDYVALIRRDGSVELANAGVDPRARSFDLDRHRAALAPALRRTFEHGERSELELRDVGDDDERLGQFVVRVAPIILDGAIERALVVATDVSERARAERERARLEGQLRQQQRLESIGTLASGVAHEINNPVQGIMNYAELIGRSPAADDDIREFAGEIGHETNRVATIVRNLLAFSRQEREEPMQRIAVTQIVDGTLSLLRAVLRKDQIQLQLEIAAGLPELRCRMQQLQQVLMNLVTNARDALNARFPGFDERKRIEIAAEQFVRDGAPWIRVSVSDQGGGVPEAVVARIFDPFFTTKGRDQGTGLGLAVSHGIVTDHGGAIRIDNQPGVGARFCIELPVAGP